MGTFGMMLSGKQFRTKVLKESTHKPIDML